MQALIPIGIMLGLNVAIAVWVSNPITIGCVVVTACCFIAVLVNEVR
jgi:hypothetical protein